MYDYTTVEPKDSTGQKAIVYFHNDQVGQVQFAFNSDGQMIYERIQTPFGETMGEMNVYNVQVPVRFPGQYADAETGYSDNWNRTYDPAIGRYVQSDPIGLRGGINTYGYVMQNPILLADPNGLAAVINNSGGSVVVGGGTGPGNGHGGSNTNVAVPDGDTVSRDKPANTPDGNGLSDVDGIDTNGDGVVSPEEKVPGNDGCPTITISTEDTDGNSQTPPVRVLHYDWSSCKCSDIPDFFDSAKRFF